MAKRDVEEFAIGRTLGEHIGHNGTNRLKAYSVPGTRKEGSGLL